jgi:hypothetical protein
VDQISYGEARLYQGELIQCRNDHDDYACSHGGVGMSGSDETDSEGPEKATKAGVNGSQSKFLAGT